MIPNYFLCLSWVLHSPELWFSGAHQEELDFFLSSWKIWETSVEKWGMTGLCKQRLGWEDTQAAFWRRAAGAGRRLYMQPFSFLCTWPSSLCSSFHHILHFSCDALNSLTSVVVGRHLSVPGVWGLGWKAPQVLPVLLLCLCLDAAARD